jgi:MIP family channel proteins
MATTLTVQTRAVVADPEQPRVGLHGHRFDHHQFFLGTIEAAGTFAVVLAIITAAVATTLENTPFGLLTVAISGGIAVAVLVAALGPISGAHFNPAVTVALASVRRFPWSRVPEYVFGQCAGAIGAALVTWWLYGARARSVAHLGASAPGAGVDAARVFGAEAMVAFLVLFVVVIVATGPRPSPQAPFAIGAVVTVAILVSGPISAGGGNPARAIGPMIVANSYTDWWLYLIAPIVGAIAATLMAVRLTTSLRSR